MAAPTTRTSAARWGGSPPLAPATSTATTTTTTAATTTATGVRTALRAPPAPPAGAAGGAVTLAESCPEHLLCSICFEVFREPHFAGCGRHAFCYGCLDALAAAEAAAGTSTDHVARITTATMSAATSVISCPLCRWRGPFTAVPPAADLAVELAATVVGRPTAFHPVRSRETLPRVQEGTRFSEYQTKGPYDVPRPSPGGDLRVRRRGGAVRRARAPGGVPQTRGCRPRRRGGGAEQVAVQPWQILLATS
jgi:hypothetical protein